MLYESDELFDSTTMGKKNDSVERKEITERKCICIVCQCQVQNRKCKLINIVLKSMETIEDSL